MKRTAYVMTPNGRAAEATADQLTAHMRLGLAADRMRALLRTGRATEAELLALQRDINDRLTAIHDNQALDDNAAVAAIHVEIAQVETKLSEMEEV